MKAYKKLYVAALRRSVKHLNLTQRRYGAATKNLLWVMKVFNIITLRRCGVA
jgi:hypothetical protein